MFAWEPLAMTDELQVYEVDSLHHKHIFGLSKNSRYYHMIFID